MADETPTMRERILGALSALLASEAAEGFFPPAPIGEAEPSLWTEIPAAGLRHAAAVQDGPPPEHLAFARGAAGAGGDELELEAAVAYAVQAAPAAGQDMAALLAARRARRDAAPRRIAALIAADPTLGISPEVYAEARPADRRDEVPFSNALPAAVAIVPVLVLYPGDSPVD